SGVADRPHPATQAADWLRATAPIDSVILREHWDEPLRGLDAYREVVLTPYFPETEEKRRNFARALADSDYLVFYSQRLYGTIPRLPDRYPLMTQYYHALFAGDLGYTLAHAATNYPRVFGVTVGDDPFARAGLPRPAGLAAFEPMVNLGFVDETFTVFDHPRVLIFQNTGALDETAILARLNAPLPPAPAATTPVRWAQDATVASANAAVSFVTAFDGGARPAWIDVALWLLAVEAIALAALPLTVALASRLPDRGVLLARPFGLLVVAWVAWVWASVGWLSFGRGSVLLAVAAVAVASGVAVALRGAALWAALIDRRRDLLIGQAHFVAVFAVFVAIRALNPDLWHPTNGGEKPMDLAFLTAVARSAAFPPTDPWFAGAPINHYYLGYVVVGALTRLTGALPEVAYNLAIPLLAALTSTGAYAVGRNLVGARPRAWLAGLAAALLVTVAGNLDTPIQLAQNLSALGRADLPVAARVADGALQLAQGAALPPFDYF
ncbi:MAG: DUF2298 domain-containing protein, partial [Dehalococcoidia bacterium]|nr:DUF2298 domain-containing protein [Dehalococcoidia bacterium]